VSNALSRGTYIFDHEKLKGKINSYSCIDMNPIINFLSVNTRAIYPNLNSLALDRAMNNRLMNTPVGGSLVISTRDPATNGSTRHRGGPPIAYK